MILSMNRYNQESFSNHLFAACVAICCVQESQENNKKKKENTHVCQAMRLAQHISLLITKLLLLASMHRPVYLNSAHKVKFVSLIRAHPTQTQSISCSATDRTAAIVISVFLCVCVCVCVYLCPSDLICPSFCVHLKKYSRSDCLRRRI